MRPVVVLLKFLKSFCPANMMSWFLYETNIAMYCKLFGVEELKHYDTKGIEARMGIEY